MNPTRTATRMFLRELGRRWRSVLFMLVMPTAYFAVTYLTSDPDARIPLSLSTGERLPGLVLDRDVKSVYLSVLGIGVAGAFAALATVRGSSAALRRLRLVGMRARHLLTARLLVLLTITAASTAIFLAIFVPLIGPSDVAAAALGLFLVGLLGVGLGTVLGMLFTREFEPAMIIVAVSGIQLAIGRGDSAGAERYLLYTPAVDTIKAATFGGQVEPTRLAIGFGYVAVLLALSYAIWSIRTRVWRPEVRRIETP